MKENINDLVQRIQGKHLEGSSRSSRSGKRRAGSFFRRHIKGLFILLILLIAAGAVFYILGNDYLTKRQNYPERNVLFRATRAVHIAGGKADTAKKEADVLSDTLFYEGGVESKVGTFLLRTIRELREDIQYFNMDDTQKIRIASATRKSEIVQAGLRLGGSLDFSEQFAEIILSRDTKATQTFRAYIFVPERGIEEVEVTVIDRGEANPFMASRMTELREWGLGWMWGKTFRAGTFLEGYRDTPENRKPMAEFHQAIRHLDSPETLDKTQREKTILRARDISTSPITFPVYFSYEDGFFDLLPQESTLYLAHRPPLSERLKDAITGQSEHIRVRVENHWDLFPGRYPLLRRIAFGKGENVIRPFDKNNNGGYTIRDRFGDLARIDIKDFILYYGQDVVYSYYLDLNGDGRLDPEKEKIGDVLCRTTHDEPIPQSSKGDSGESRPGESFTIHYSFMAPDNDLEKGMQNFIHCGQIESLMPDQVNRGFGKHSILGYINQQRSDIILFKDLTIENMSRALTEESTLVAQKDIVNLLIAARRPYAEEVAGAFGIGDDFEGRYQPSDRLTLRRDWGGWMGLSAAVVLAGLFFVFRYRQKMSRKASRSL